MAGIVTAMARTARAVGGLCYHVLNRGNSCRAVFHKDGDFAAFVQALQQVAAEASSRPPGTAGCRNRLLISFD